MTLRLLLPALAAAMMFTPEGASASTIPVTTLEDVVDSADGTCSVREAILAVNAPPGSGDCVRADANANTISLGAGTHTLTRTGAGEGAASTGDLDVLPGTVSLALVGAGAGQTTISGAGLGDRLLDIQFGAPSVTVQNMTLTGGRAPSGGLGAEGAAGGTGESGGAIRSLAALTLADAVVTDNRAGAGGAGGRGQVASGGMGGGSGSAGGSGGAGGDGGAIDISGALTLTRVVFSFDLAGQGGAGGDGGAGSSGFPAGNGGLGGTGGAVAVTTGPLVATGVQFDGNRAGGGGDGGRGGFPTGGGASAGGGAGGAGGRAGAVFTSGGATVGQSSFVANAAGAGGAGGAGAEAASTGGPAAGGAGANGGTAGAILAQSGNFTLLNLTLVTNRAGAGGAGGDGGEDQTGSNTFGGTGGAGGAGGNAGALRRQLTGAAYLTHGTVIGNLRGAGGAGGRGGFGTNHNGAPGAAGTAGTTGGISDGSVTNDRFTEVTNSIVASNAAGNCAGGFVDGGRNIAFGDVACTGFTIADPLLGALADNGGPVETSALLAGSPAIDQVPADGAGCPATDARGAPRPVGGQCDIGAFEVSPPACQAVAATAAAGVPTPITLTCTSPASAPFTFAISSQPAHGTLSGLDALTGFVTYTADAAYAGADGFGFDGTTADGTASATVGVTVTPASPSGGPGATAARLSLLKVSPRKFRAARTGPSALALRTATGARVTFALDQAASVRFKVAKRLKGRRSGKRCVKPTKRNRRAKACTRTVAVKGSFSRAGTAGANAFRFTGRMRGRKLARGGYVLRATPASGKTVSVAFQIVR